MEENVFILGILIHKGVITREEIKSAWVKYMGVSKMIYDKSGTLGELMDEYLKALKDDQIQYPGRN